MEHEFRKWFQVKDIIESTLAKAGADNVRRRMPAKRWPSKRSEPIFEKGKRFFLDVGGWYGNPKGFAHTDFGIVSGNYVLVCSWLNMEGKTRGLKYNTYCKKNRLSFTEKIAAFFDMPKGAIVAHFESPEPFVSDKELIVFLPDLHLHLCRETVIDNFTYNRNFRAKKEKPDIVSLEDELAEFLKHGQSLGAVIIQVGDCFEVWEAQAHLVEDHERLCNFLEEHSNKSYLTWIEGKPSLIDILDYMSKKRKMVPRNKYQFAMDDFNYIMGRFKRDAGFSMPLTYDQVDQLGIPIYDTYTGPTAPKSQVDVIREMIMANYKNIFDNKNLKTDEIGMPFRWLRGNHDNMRRNYYYEKVEEKDYRFEFSHIIRRAGLPPEMLDAYDIYRGGIDRCIWAEHGHRLDSANADSICYLKGNGYYWTKFFTTGRIIGESGWKQGAIELAVQEEIEHYGYYMRGDQLNLVYDIFNNDEEVRLVVMGHTHSAALVDWGIFLREVKRRVEN
jgi:UDP-2,3-diacylglucosamine pyrophosphatase LpxH